MNLAPIEDAIRTWIKNATALPDAQIYFQFQNGGQPTSAPFITITVPDSWRALGAYAEQTKTTNLGNPNGSEITYTATSEKDALITIQAFAENTVTFPNGNPPALPNTSGLTAMALLSACQTALGLDGVRYALNQAGVGVYDEGHIRQVNAVIETYFEGRAVLEIRCYLVDQATESDGYINEVTGTGTLFEDGLPNRTAPIDVVGS